jgi:hypothetical protein
MSKTPHEEGRRRMQEDAPPWRATYSLRQKDIFGPAGASRRMYINKRIIGISICATHPNGPVSLYGDSFF